MAFPASSMVLDQDDQAIPRRVWAGMRDWLSGERERWALWLPVAFAVGVAVYFSLDREPPPWPGLAGLGAAAAIGALGRRRTGLGLLAVALAALSAGFLAGQLRSALVAAPIVEKRLGPLNLVGQLDGIEARGRRTRLTLRRLEIPGLAPERTPVKVRISAAGDFSGFRPGDWLRLRAVLLPPPEPAAPGAFDFARWAYFKGLGGVGFGVGRPRRLEPGELPSGAARSEARGQAPEDPWSWGLWWRGLRHSVARRVAAAVPGETGAVAVALMTGERGAIPPAVMTAMRDSGLAHLLAISGLHVGLVAGLLFFGLRAVLALAPVLALNRPIKKWAALVAGLGALVYLLLTGATVPTQRALLMTGVVLLAVMLDRRALTLRLVAWAALVILALSPENLLSASFQMSFAAVTALIAGYEFLGERRTRRLAEGGRFTQRSVLGRVCLYVAGVALTSIIAGLATAPFAVYHFNRIAWYGLAANLVAVPITAIWIMPWAILGFILLPLGAEALALIPMGWGIAAMLRVAETVAAWPGAVSLVPAMPTAGVALIAGGGLWLCLWRRRWRLLGLGPILAGALTVPLSAPPDVLASGDGKLFAVRAPDGTLLVSTRRARRFEAEIWARRAGQPAAAAWPRAGTAAGGRLRCDPLGCLYRTKGQVVALVQDSRALIDDCAAATVLVSREPVRDRACRRPGLVIDRFDLWRHGGHALWLTDGKVKVKTVRQHRGQRPWAQGRTLGRGRN